MFIKGCLFIHSFILKTSYKDSKTGKPQEQPRFGSSKAVSVGTDLAGLRRTDPRAVMEKWRALVSLQSPQKVRELAGPDALEPGWRAGGVRAALQGKLERWVLFCRPPGLCWTATPRSGRWLCGVMQSGTRQWAPDTAQHSALPSDVRCTGSKTKKGGLP